MKHLMMTMMMMAAPVVGMAQGKSGIDPANLDKSVRAADDFYQFATGGWQKRNPLPAAYSLTSCRKTITSASTRF